MFTEKEIYGEPCISTLVKDASSIEFNENDSVEEMSAKFGTIDMICSCCKGAPAFVTRYTPYIEETDGVQRIKHITVSIRLRKHAMIDGDSFSEHRKFAWNSDIYADIISFICNWIDNYNIILKVESNADELSKAVAPYCDTIKVSFAYSDSPIVAIDNTSVTVGLSDMALANIANISLFSDNVLVSDIAKDNCAKLLKSFVSPIDIFRSKDQFVKELGIPTRAGVMKLLKKGYKKSITDKSAINIPCRFEKDGYAGIIKRVPIAEVMEDDNIAYVDDDYGYIFVLNPVGKDDEMITDVDKLESMVKEVVS